MREEQGTLFVVIFVFTAYAWQKLPLIVCVEYAESILASLFFGSNFFDSDQFITMMYLDDDHAEKSIERLEVLFKAAIN